MIQDDNYDKEIFEDGNLYSPSYVDDEETHGNRILNAISLFIMAVLMIYILNPLFSSDKNDYKKISKKEHSFQISPEEFDQILEYIKTETVQPSITLVPDLNSDPTLTDSKIGGIPYWNPKMKYPVDENNEKMKLLCQLNFSDSNINNTILPSKGILQFFISATDECYGVNWEDNYDQTNWRIIYHNTFDKNIKYDDIKDIIFVPDEDGFYPVEIPCKIDLVESESYIQISNYNFESVLNDAIKKVTGKNFDVNSYDFFNYYYDENNTYYDLFISALYDGECHLLGYPDFTQFDIREDLSLKELEDFNILLLQLNSACWDDIICWGDYGIANFFINSEALKNNDFSKVYYNWDCY